MGYMIPQNIISIRGVGGGGGIRGASFCLTWKRYMNFIVWTGGVLLSKINYGYSIKRVVFFNAWFQYIAQYISSRMMAADGLQGASELTFSITILQLMYPMYQLSF